MCPQEKHIHAKYTEGKPTQAGKKNREESLEVSRNMYSWESQAHKCQLAV